MLHAEPGCSLADAAAVQMTGSSESWFDTLTFLWVRYAGMASVASVLGFSQVRGAYADVQIATETLSTNL